MDLSVGARGLTGIIDEPLSVGMRWLTLWFIIRQVLGSEIGRPVRLVVVFS